MGRKQQQPLAELHQKALRGGGNLAKIVKKVTLYIANICMNGKQVYFKKCISLTSIYYLEVFLIPRSKTLSIY